MAGRFRLLAVIALAAGAALATLVARAPTDVDVGCPSRAASPEPTATPTTAPKLAVTNDPVTFEVDNGVASSVVFVRNNGAEATARIRVFTAGCDTNVVTFSKRLRAGAAEPVRVTFPFEKGMKRSGRIVVDSHPEAGGEPGAAGFTVAKDDPSGNALAGAGFGSALVALGLLVGRWRHLKPRRKLSDPLTGIDSKWSFKESWASNLTAFGAIFTTVIATTGFAGDYLGDVSTARFVALMLFWTGLALLAPVAFSAWTKERNAAEGDDDVVVATGWGLLLGAFLTTTAVLGQLATLGVVVWYSGFSYGPRCFVAGMLLVAMAIVGVYVSRGVRHAAVDVPTPEARKQQGGQTRNVLVGVEDGTVVVVIQVASQKRSGIL